MAFSYTHVSQLKSSEKEWKVRVLEMSRVWDFHLQYKLDILLGIYVVFVDEKFCLRGAPYCFIRTGLTSFMKEWI
uniref:Uncharacterized protein n=1 Tax=Noccaea caerulescens TaxID=107243 RepID=A0A1J3CUM4_NOCCA